MPVSKSLSATLAVKHEVISTTNTPGWSYAMEIANRIVLQMEREAIDEDDDAKGTQLRREAKAARKFLSSFNEAIKITRDLEPPPEDDQFVEVAY